MVIKSNVDSILIATNGTNGQPGAAGTSSYLHVKYSNDGGLTFTANNGETIGAYIGIYKDSTEADSTNIGDYQWKKIEGEDAYTVMLSNENFTISTDDTYVPLHTQTFHCNVTVLKGASPIAFTITAAADTENDIVTTINGSNVTITVATAEVLSATSGAIALTISADGQTFTKNITWAVAAKGSNGTIGVSITDVINYYLATNKDSGVTKSDSGWTTTIQNIDEHKQYLWNYEEVVGSTGGIISSSDPVIIGRYGRDGAAAAEGRGIVSIEEHYQISSSNTTAPTTWVSNPVATTPTNKYLWNYETIHYTDNTTQDTDPRVIGTHGASGASPTAYSLIVSHAAVAKSESGVYNPTSITLTAKSQTGSEALVNYDGRFKIESTTDNNTWTAKYTSSKNESSYTYTIPSNIKALRCSLYLAGGTTTLLDTQTVPIVSDGVSPNVTSSKADGVTTVTITTASGTNTITINDGEDGTPGASIDSITNYYLATSASSGVTTSTAGWKTDPTQAVMTSTNQYLWNYEVAKDTNGNTISTTTPTIIGRYGQNGSAGKGITSITEYYAKSASTTAPEDSEFGTSVVAVDATNKYLWNYEVITYTTDSPTTTDKHIIGVYGDPGKDAYTVVLSNENHSFAADTSKAVATNITVNVLAYKGATQVAAKIGTISGQVTGLTTSLVSNNTTSAGFKVTVTNSLTTKSGVLTIPITVDDKSFTKKFSWSLALTGQKGDDGHSIVSITPYFLLSASDNENDITFPEAGNAHGWTTVGEALVWSKTKPYLWHCTEIVYENPSATIYTDKYCDTSWKAADLVQANLTEFQEGVDSVVDRENQSIRQAVWENTYAYKPKKDADGNFVYDENGKIVPDKDTATTMSQYMAEQIVNTEGITSRVSSAESGISGLNSSMSEVTQKADKIGWIIDTNGSTASSLTLTDSALTAMTKQFVVKDPNGNATVIEGGKITVNNLVGDHGWINLKDGKFYYGDKGTFAASTNAISWNGNKLQIKADEFLLASGKSIFDEIEAIETWFYAAAPTTSNEPAKNWTTDNLKEMHLRDIYFDTDSGKSYRWAKEGTAYKWVEIEDKELAAVAGRVSANETAIEKNASDILLRATKTELTNAVGRYATSSTAKGTAAKVATIIPAVTDWQLTKGAIVTVKFTNENTATTPTLNINGTGAKTIKAYTGTAALTEAEYKWPAGTTLDFVYDGSYWRIQDSTELARISSAETTIKQNSEAIELRATKTELSGAIDQEVKDRDAAIKLSADGITSSVSSTYATKTSVPTKVSQLTNDSKYSTQTEAQGYASDAQAAAEKTAAADATEKANKAEANAKADTLAKVTGFYATCPTAAGTKAKVATIVPAVTGWTLYTGATITVKFTAANTNSAPTLNVNGTGAKAIKTYANANLSEAEYKWSAGDTFTFVYNGTNWLMEDSTLITRVTTAETSITQTNTKIELKANASDVYTKTDVDGKISQEVSDREAAIKESAEAISLSVSETYSTKSEAAQMAQPNLAPYHSSQPFSLENPYWVGFNSSTNIKPTFTYMGDGWTRIQYTNTGSGTGRRDFYPAKAPNIKQGQNYTWLLEFRNNQSTDLTTAADFYMVQTSKLQFWGDIVNGAKYIQENDEHPLANYRISTIPTGTDGTVYTRRFLKPAETATGGHWSNNSEESVLGLAAFTARCNAGGTIDYEFRISVYEGEYRGPYKPYAGTQLFASQSELKVTAEGITSEVSKISSAKYINSTVTTWTLANIKTYATEGKSTTFNVDDTSGLRVGDTVYIKGTDTTRDCTVYIKVTVTAIPSATKVTGTGHGYEDVLPVDTIKSTINQSSDSVKIQAKHVEIDGTAVFSSIKTSLDSNYDAKGAASTAESNAKNDTADKLKSYSTTTEMTSAISTSAGNTLKDAKSYADTASLSAGTEYIVGTQTAATNAWTGETKESSLVAGKSIAYKLPYAGTSSAATLNLTLAGGTKTGAKAIKQIYSTSSNTGALANVTTHWPVNSVIQMTYDGTQWLISNYNTNVNTNYYDRRLHNNYILAAGAVAAGALACGTSAGYKQIAAGITFDLSYPILLAIAAWTSGTQYANGYEAYPSMNPATTGTVQAIALNATVYLKGTVSGNTFTIASSNFLTCTAPTSEDGFFYIPLGVVANDATTKMYFASSKDLYAYIDGKFRQVTPTEVVASQRIYYRSSVNTKPTAMPTAWVTETGDKYATNATTAANWSTKVTPISSDKTSATATKYLYLWTCEQRKRLDGTLAYTNVLLDDSTTVIDGGNIVTGTVTANQIAAGAVTAEKIKAGEITADKLNATNINASGTLTVGAFNAEIKSTILNSNRNLIVGTRIPDVSAANKLPHILNQQINTATSSGTLTEAEHGVRITNSGAFWTRIQFGETTVASGGMNGLEAGKTYTLSFDSTWKVLSGTTETTTRYMTAYLYDNSADAATFANTAYKRFGTVTQANRGTVMSGRCEFTFTVPEATTKTYILIANNRTTANNYDTGDFIEIRNLKLEEGSVATPWSYAPEDVDDAIAASSAALAESINESIDDVTKAMTNGFSDIDETLSSQAGAIASQAEGLSDLTGVVDGQGSSISQMNGTLTSHTNSISALEETQANINGWMQFDPTDANPALIIGRNGSQMTTRIFNDKLSFYDGGDEVAYVGSNQLHIKNAEIESNLQIGKYLFKPHANGDGGMSLVWNE